MNGADLVDAVCSVFSFEIEERHPVAAVNVKERRSACDLNADRCVGSNCGSSRRNVSFYLVAGLNVNDSSNVVSLAADRLCFLLNALDVTAVDISDVDQLIVRIAESVSLTREQIALVVYVVAMNVPLTDAVVLKALKCGKSQAYVLRDRVMASLRAELETLETATDVAFGDVLLERCSAMLSAELHRELEGRR